MPTYATRTVSLQVAGTSVSQTLQLNGPGHVTGLDAAQILRVAPVEGTKDFEPNLFPFIELADPDLPWRYTPVGTSSGKLRPWLVLVVVERREGVSLSTSADGGLAQLTVETPALDLPDLSESWAWAHVQVALPDGGTSDLEALLADEPERFLARLICPRRLESNKRWIACLVPATDAGRAAGLGEPLPSGTTLADAWTLTDASVRLPVYHHWSFSTGPDGDFEALARRLTPNTLGADVGLRELDLSAPGGGLPEGGKNFFEGALRSSLAVRPAWTGPKPAAFRTALEARLEAGANLLTTPAGNTVADDPFIAPPIYGSVQANTTKVPDMVGAWLRDLSLDPSRRAAAALGAAVVRRNQEALVASAWEQLDGLHAINDLLRRSSLAAVVGKKLRARVEALSDGAFSQLTRPLHGRVRSVDAPTTTFRARYASALPGGVVSAAMSRMLRPGGTVQRTFYALRVTAPSASTVPQSFLSGTVLDPNFATLKVPSGTFLASRYVEIDTGGLSTITQSGRTTVLKSTTLRAGIGLSATKPPTHSTATISPTLVSSLRTAVAPTARMASHLRSRITAPTGAWGGKQVPSRMRGTLSFDDPLANELLRLDPEALLPGLGTVPDESASLLAQSSAFIEAFLVGANHEFTSELVWRELPADPTGTPFRRFWDTDTTGTEDISAIKGWSKLSTLGSHVTGSAAGAGLVLLVKGSLLQRYPDVVIYAVRATWSSGKRVPLSPEERREPLFSGSVGAGTRYLGFNLSLEEARGSRVTTEPAGWFFVFQEQPTAPRFGLDVAQTADFTTLPTTWNNVSWGHMATSSENLETVVHATTAGRLAGRTLSGATWGKDAAHMARITMQQPARLYLHADAMLGQGA
jgi:hypothetical protein